MSKEDLLQICCWCAYAFTLIILTTITYTLVKYMNFNQWIIAFLCVIFSHHVIGGVLKIIKKVSKNE